MASQHGPAGPSKLDIPVRLSFVSGTSQTKDPDNGTPSYTQMKTPDPANLEGGALREGGAPSLTSRDSIGLLFQYAAVGINYGLLPATVYPFLQQCLNATGSQVTTASTLVILPWSFKVFYGILSDCVPICGYRRKIWMLIGWGMCLAMLIVMAASPAGDPYYTVPSDRDIAAADITPEIEARINYDAGNQAGKYVMLMFFAAIGYVLADVCADSIVVDFAQREPFEHLVELPGVDVHRGGDHGADPSHYVVFHQRGEASESAVQTLHDRTLEAHPEACCVPSHLLPVLPERFL